MSEPFLLMKERESRIFFHPAAVLAQLPPAVMFLQPPSESSCVLLRFDLSTAEGISPALSCPGLCEQQGLELDPLSHPWAHKVSLNSLTVAQKCNLKKENKAKLKNWTWESVTFAQWKDDQEECSSGSWKGCLFLFPQIQYYKPNVPFKAAHRKAQKAELVVVTTCVLLRFLSESQLLPIHCIFKSSLVFFPNNSYRPIRTWGRESWRGIKHTQIWCNFKETEKDM